MFRIRACRSGHVLLRVLLALAVSTDPLVASAGPANKVAVSPAQVQALGAMLVKVDAPKFIQGMAFARGRFPQIRNR